MAENTPAKTSNFSVWRIIAWLFWLAFWGMLAVEALAYMETGEWRFQAVGEVLFKIDPGSLNFVQAIVQRYLHPAIWDPGIIYILQTQMIYWLITPALLCSVIAYMRRRRSEAEAEIKENE